MKIETDLLENRIQKKYLDKNIDFLERPDFQEHLFELNGEQIKLIANMYVRHFYDVEFISKWEKIGLFEKQYKSGVRIKKFDWDHWVEDYDNIKKISFDYKGKKHKPKLGTPRLELSCSLFEEVEKSKKNIRSPLSGKKVVKCPECFTYHLEDKLKETPICPECKTTYKCDCGIFNKIEATSCSKCKKENYLALYHKGNLLKSLGKYEKAIDYYNKLLRVQIKEFNYLNLISETFNYKGACLKALGRNVEALECYRSALALNPENKDCQKHIDELDNSVYEKVVEHCNEQLKTNPKNSNALGDKGFALTKLGKLEDALECYKQACELSPGEYYEEYIKDLKTKLEGKK